jgi:hypothetical protein
MATTLSHPKTFKSVAAESANGGVSVALPFDPAKVWGERARYHLGGTINGAKMRAIVKAGERAFVLGPMWRRDCGLAPGDAVTVTLALEGPQQDELAEDFAAALAAEPKAAAFWDDLAQFYRKAYLTWINGTKKKPEERARRIKETIKLLKTHQKARLK